MLGANGLSLWMCQHYGSILIYCFVLSRMTVYIFFILRAFYAFRGSVLQYNTKMIASLIICIIVYCNVVGTTLIYFIETGLKANIAHNSIGERCLRIPVDDNSSAQLLILVLNIFSIVMDTLAQFLPTYLLLSKIFQSIFEFNNDNPKFILLATKQTVLLFIVIISKQIWLLLGFFVPLMSGIMFSMDNMVNAYCLWLSFAVNDQIYKKYFCGNKLTKWCFPVIKSVAICCYEERNCCCCCVCCTCDAIKQIKQRDTYINAKQEIELIINSQITQVSTIQMSIPDSPVSLDSP